MWRWFLFITLYLFGNNSFAQTGEKAEFSVEEMEFLLVKGLNQFRIQNNVDSFDIESRLLKIAQMQSHYMANLGKATTEQGGKLGTTAKRIQSVGGSTKGDEIVISYAVAKGKESIPTSQVVSAILQKLTSSKKEKPIILNPNYNYLGFGSSMDKDLKKVYISFVFGSYETFNTGASKRKEIPVKYSKKNKGIIPGDPKLCKNCEKFKDYYGLINGLYVKDGEVFIKYSDLKSFKKLMKSSGDALAIDVVQRAQYEKPGYNIYNTNLLTKGVQLKKVNSDKLYANNLFNSEDKKNNQLEVSLGKIPKKIKGEIELNLMVIQEGALCKYLIPSYAETPDSTTESPLEMLLSPDSLSDKTPFKPTAESTLLNFVVPFEKNKYDYKKEDIEPLLNAMQEPDYMVEGLYIYAYSSIEGDSASNSQLQKKRAESIISTFRQMHSNEIATNVKTSDSWNLFKLEMEDGKFDYLTKLPKQKAIAEINNKGLADTLEPYLSKQRFAQVVLDVTYDIKGAKEEKYCIAQFNKAVRKGEKQEAMRIQKYLVGAVKSGKYSKECLEKLDIPKQATNSAVLNDKVVYKYLDNYKEFTPEILAELYEIQKADPNNPYVKFNTILAYLKLNDITDKNDIANCQSQVESLYSSKIPAKILNALNAELQFKIIESLDSVPGSGAQIQASIDKIKSFYNFKESTWENSLKLAHVFIKFKDYKYAAAMLEPFLNSEDVDMRVLDAYASACAMVPEKIKGRQFVNAMKKMAQKDSNHFCEMIGAPFLTFQVLDNPQVKEVYHKVNCPKPEDAK